MTISVILVSILKIGSSDGSIFRLCVIAVSLSKKNFLSDIITKIQTS